tara:strand:- start:197 stop:1090 length:894 start_codon:yes stop_codon:yes gene_type:complete
MSPKMKQHKRTIACVVDTETCFKNSDAHGLVYHFGAVFGNIEQTESYHVKEMDYYVKETMQEIGNFLFKNKDTGEAYATNGAMARAWKDAINNTHKIKAWKDIIKEFNNNMNSMGVDILTAYNYNFDIGEGRKIGTIRKTHTQYTHKSFYLKTADLNVCCLMDISATLLMNKDFYSWTDSLNAEDKARMTTEKGNLSYSAESVARWLNLDVDYIEPHTAQHDAQLEFMILCKAWSTHKNVIKKHFLNNIRGVSWKTIQDKKTMKAKLDHRNKLVKATPKPKKVIKPMATNKAQGDLF